MNQQTRMVGDSQVTLEYLAPAEMTPRGRVTGWAALISALIGSGTLVSVVILLVILTTPGQAGGPLFYLLLFLFWFASAVLASILAVCAMVVARRIRATAAIALIVAWSPVPFYAVLIWFT